MAPTWPHVDTPSFHLGPNSAQLGLILASKISVLHGRGCICKSSCDFCFRAPKMVSRWPQEGPKSLQESPERPQVAPKAGPRETKSGPKGAPDCPKTAPRRPQDGPISLPGPRTPLDPSKEVAKKPSGGSQKAPTRPPRVPRMIQRASMRLRVLGSEVLGV